MRWYEGDIEQAVVTSKTRNAIFVVYVEGKDEKSTNLTSHINSTDVSTKLESDNFVALKVEAGSVPHTQFAAIYSNVQVPSIFFIGKSGQPIDIITESSSSSDLSARINSVIQTHTGVAVSAPTTSNSAAKLSESLIQSEKQPVEVPKPEKDNDTVCENGVCAKIPSKPASSDEKSEESPPTDSSTAFLEQEKQELSKEEKMERAKQLVEEKREAKRQQDEEDEKKKELERRKLGQDVQKMQRSQQDQELKNLLEERQRAKTEEKAARDRILAQIAQDKADRAARFAPSAVASSPQQTTERPTASNVHVSRLQFRLPDGTSQTHEFQASAVLSEVRDFISANLRLPFRSFSLSTTFPRREFTADDANTSLRDLQLVPNAVIMVLPAHTGATVSSSEGGGFLSILWLLVAPIINIFDYFRSLIFGQPDNSATAPTVQPDDRDEPETEPQLPAAKRKTMETTVVRRQGNSNIHRLSDRSESDDDNNTWNGNSTQQM
ncbi:uncharacterized protein CBL_08262 [Carabus blaptoides fortunei]